MKYRGWYFLYLYIDRSTFCDWHGSHFSYHGTCDLVLLHNPDFDSGKSLNLHVWTAHMINEYLSCISNEDCWWCYRDSQWWILAHEWWKWCWAPCHGLRLHFDSDWGRSVPWKIWMFICNFKVAVNKGDCHVAQEVCSNVQGVEWKLCKTDFMITVIAAAFYWKS